MSNKNALQTLVAQAVEKSPYRDNVKMIADTSDVKLRIQVRVRIFIIMFIHQLISYYIPINNSFSLQDQFIVQITSSFRCAGIWPRTANFWPLNAANINWPEPSTVAEVKTEGFDLFRYDAVLLGFSCFSYLTSTNQ